MLKNKTKLMASAAAFGLIGAAIVLWLGIHKAAPRPRLVPLESAIYIWQGSWSNAVADAAIQANSRAGRFCVLAGHLEIDGSDAKAVQSSIDWEALAKTDRPAVLVIRAPVALAKSIASGGSSAAAEILFDAYGAMPERAAKAGCTIAGLQLDYDCPTARLQDYQKLLESLIPRMGSAELSITVLPTWMQNKAFGPLIKAVPRYTLQVHGVETPTTIDKPIVLCDTSKIAGWVRRAASFGVPFDVALPTYGYRVIFDASGKFAGLAAEGPERRLSPGFQERFVDSDPIKIAAVVRELRRASPAELKGLIWFRLPIASDRLNWPWPTLAAVMDGKEPRKEYQTEVRSPESGLYEIWIRNAGETPGGERVRIPVDKTNLDSVASDLMQDCIEEDSGTIVAPAPGPGNVRLVAWYRVESSGNSPPLKVGRARPFP